MGFYGFSFAGSPLSVSWSETSKNCRDRRAGEFGFADLILSAVRFLFRRTKLARTADWGNLFLQI